MSRKIAKQIVAEASNLFEEKREADANPPPSYNMGVETPKGQISGCVDWISCTFPGIHDPAIVQHLIGGEWTPMDHGHHGYRSGYIQGGIMVMYDGGSPNMGVHLQASGTGCRDLEALGRIRTWQEFLAELQSYGGKFTRFDPALDDRLGILRFSDIDEALEKKTIASRWRSADPRQKISLAENAEPLGRTVYFGSATSDAKCRIYDKASQTKTEAAGPWMRVELEFRKERAMACVDAFISGGIRAMCDILKGYLDFKVRGDDSHRDRWKTAEWWQMFLHLASKARLELDPTVRTLEKSRQWIQNSVAPTLAVIFQALGGDVDAFYAEMKAYCDNGKRRWKHKHKDLLATAV